MELEVRKDNNLNLTAVQDNELVRSAYTMTLTEKRLLLLAISKVNSTQYPKSNSCITVTVTSSEWASLYGEGNAYRDLKEASKGIFRRQVTLNPGSKDKVKVLNWLDSCVYHEKTGRVDVVFGYSISKLLAGMLDCFTQIDLLDVAKLNSRHSVRTLELLSQMKNPNSDSWWLQISVDEYKACLGVDGQYSRFAEFKRSIVEPVCKELTAKAGLDLEVEYLKTGRKVTAIKFKYRDQMSLAF